MTEPIDNHNNNNNNNNKCYYIDKFDEFWDEYKYRISSKLSIGLGILSGVGSAMVSMKLFIPASIILGCVSAGVFFAGIALSKYENKTINLEKDNHSLKQEMTRKMTLINNFNFPNENCSISPLTPTSNTSTNTHYEEVVDINFK